MTNPTRLTVLFLLALTTAAAATPAPHVSIASMSDLPVVTMAPYDVTADADKTVDAAFARAKAHHKRVLIDLGGNWCTDCVIFANIMQLPEVKRFVDAHYEVAVVNVGRFNTNLQIPARFGITTRLEGVPAVLIADPNSGRLIDQGHIAALADARHMTPQGIADWLAEWAE